MATLGKEISDLIDQQNALLAATTDPREVDKIKAYIEDLDEQREDLIDNSWNPTTAEYQDLVDQLSKATKALNDARKGLETIDNALKLVGAAVEALAKL